MTEKQVLVKNLNIHYKIFGELTPLTSSLIFQGKPLLILHGWPSNSDKWIQVSELLAKKYKKVIVLDLPGFGKSQQLTKAWSLDDYIDLIKEFSLSIEELNNGFILLGHSFGGAIAAKFAIKYNQKIEKLFLISAACIRQKTATKNFFAKIAKPISFFSFIPYYSFLRKLFYKFILKKSDYPFVSGLMKESYLKIISDDLSYQLKFIKVSTVIIWGDKDSSTPIQQAYAIHKKIENSKLIVIKDAGHSLQIQAPEMLAEKIAENLPS